MVFTNEFKTVRATRLYLNDPIVQTFNVTDKETKVQRDGLNVPKD